MTAEGYSIYVSYSYSGEMLQPVYDVHFPRMAETFLAITDYDTTTITNHTAWTSAASILVVTV